MKPSFLIKTSKIASLIIVSGISGLVLFSVAPWITYEDTYLNMEGVTNIDNLQVKNLVGDLEIINLCFWLLIMFGIISYFGIALHLYGKYSPIAKILIFAGCTNIVFSGLIVILHITLINNIDETSSASLIVSHLPIKYAYLPMITGVVSLIGSASYAGYIVFYLIRLFRDSEKDTIDKEPEEKSKNVFEMDIKTSEEPKFKDIQHKEIIDLPKPQANIDEPMIPEKKDILTTPPVQKTYSEPEPSQPPEPEEKTTQPVFSKESTDIKETPEEPFEAKKIEQPTDLETPPEPNQEQLPKSEDKLQPSPLFEKALSSAIEKRHLETQKEDKEKKQQSEEY